MMVLLDEALRVQLALRQSLSIDGFNLLGAESFRGSPGLKGSSSHGRLVGMMREANTMHLAIAQTGGAGRFLLFYIVGAACGLRDSFSHFSASNLMLIVGSLTYLVYQYGQKI